MREINILITAASRRVPLIQGFVQALKHLGVRGNVVTTDMNTLSPGLYFSTRHYLVPLTTDERYIPYIKSICFKERIHLLIPTIDDELPLFGAFADSFLEMGVRVAVSGREIGAICNDKHRTVHFPGRQRHCRAAHLAAARVGFRQPQLPAFSQTATGQGKRRLPLHSQ